MALFDTIKNNLTRSKQAFSRILSSTDRQVPTDTPRRSVAPAFIPITQQLAASRKLPGPVQRFAERGGANVKKTPFFSPTNLVSGGRQRVGEEVLDLGSKFASGFLFGNPEETRKFQDIQFRMFKGDEVSPAERAFAKDFSLSSSTSVVADIADPGGASSVTDNFSIKSLSDAIKKQADEVTSLVDDIPLLTSKSTAGGRIRIPEKTTIFGKDFVVAEFSLPKTKGVAKNEAMRKIKSLVNKTKKEAAEIDEAVLRQQVLDNLPDKQREFEILAFGSPTETAASLQQKFGGTKQSASVIPGVGKVEDLWSSYARSFQENVNDLVRKGLHSDYKAVRTAASAMKGLFGGLGNTKSLQRAKDALSGGMSRWQNDSYRVSQDLYDIVPDEKSWARINAVMDPEISTLKVDYKDLTPQEKAAYEIIRNGLDYIHDWNFANGFIDKDLYLKHKGSYTPRGYTTYELPDEVREAAAFAGRRIDEGIFKGRQKVTDELKEKSLNNPIHMFAKRLSQTGTNSTILDYGKYLTREGLAVDDAKPGFIKLSDSKSYGPIAGKYVPQDVAEDFKGFFFTNVLIQKLYEGFRLYDQTNIRQFRKAMLTVYTPTVQLGNVASDNVFGFCVGVDPFSLNKNLKWAKSQAKNNSGAYRYLLEQNILKTGHHLDLANSLKTLDSVTDDAVKSDKNMLKLVAQKGKGLDNKVKAAYGAVDDLYKLAAFKSLLDKGVTAEDATRIVADGFQNYKTVGKFYDVASKTPILGNAFIKFKADLVRLIKNAVVNKPLHLASFLVSLKVIGDFSSMISGETPEEKEVRESRAFIPMIPGLDIPLVWQTPYGELNVARYISPYYAYTSPYASGIPAAISILMPYQTDFVDRTANPSGKTAVNIARSVEDPLLSPFVQLLLNSDFRGKPIDDPNSNVFTGKTTTTGEEFVNKANFLRRQFQPQTVTDVENLVRSVRGKEDIYGRERTPIQSLFRIPGVKLEQFGPEQVKEQVQRDKYFKQLEIKDIKAKMNRVAKLLNEGKIDRKTAEKRLEALREDMEKASEELRGTSSVNNVNKAELFNPYAF